MHAPVVWAQGNVQFGIDLLEETAGLISEVMGGNVPVSQGEAYAMVFKEAKGVVLGIAPWNAPVLLGFEGFGGAVGGGKYGDFQGEL